MYPARYVMEGRPGDGKMSFLEKIFTLQDEKSFLKSNPLPVSSMIFEKNKALDTFFPRYKSSHLFSKEKEGTLAIFTLSLDPKQEGGRKREGFRLAGFSPRPLSMWTHRSISYPAFSWTLG